MKRVADTSLSLKEDRRFAFAALVTSPFICHLIFPSSSPKRGRRPRTVGCGRVLGLHLWDELIPIPFKDATPPQSVPRSRTPVVRDD